VRAFLMVIMGAMLLGGCAAKPTAKSAQAVSAQEDKDSAACLEQPLKKESYDEHQKSFASCMRAKGYHEEKLYPSETTANARNPSISDGLKTIARESGPGLAASEDYERAVADYNNCVLEHTSNLSACEKQQAIMNGLGKVSSRSSSSQSYQTTSRISQAINTAGAAQGGNVTPRIAAGVTQSATAANTPQTTSSLPARVPPTTPETPDPEAPDARSMPTPPLY
jgi:hypothetical protein